MWVVVVKFFFLILLTSCSLSQGSICPPRWFDCGNGKCIAEIWHCDGENDCGNFNDEKDCGDPCEKANCSQNCKNTPMGPRCYCNEGFSLNSNDNKTCNDIDECQQEGFCSHDCTNTVGSYKCFCHDGYELINRTCRAVGADPLLIYSNGKEIRGISLRSNQYFPVATAESQISAVHVDPKSGRVYWIDISNRSTIYSAKTDGNELRSVLSRGLLIPEGIAVDYITHNLYITDSGLRQVLACKADGKMCHVLHSNVEKPRSIVLDPDSGFMYWSDWGEHAPGIFKSGMDGSRRISMVSNRIGWPNGIALDHTTNRLYWVDAKLHTIEFITLDGTLRTVLLNGTVYHPFSLAVFEDTLYWSDWTTFSLESCNKFTGHKVTILTRQSENKIMGVHVYHPVLISKASNPCWSNDCSHMCLMSPAKRFVCACPHGFTLSSDQKTCIKEQGESLFVSEGSSIFYINPKMVGSESVTELPLALGDASITGVAYDSKLRYMFVADAKRPAIYAVNMTSFSMRELVSSYLGSPVDLSFDWKSNNLYWIDRAKHTVEIININLLRRVVILRDLQTPVALAISPAQGYMFISSLGPRDCLSMYDMDGKNQKIFYSVQGQPVSLSLHPSKSLLYWADSISENISYMDYTSNRPAETIKRKLNGVISISISEEYIYWTSMKRELNKIKGGRTYVLQLPGQGKGEVIRKVTYSADVKAPGLSMCLIGNGGCSYACLTSPAGRTCACSSDMILSSDGTTCIAKKCDPNDFRCVNGRCLPTEKRCDGTKDCSDGSDEVGCSDKCSADDFQCKNGRCILKPWRCDFRDDCGDNSDEEDCPPATNCSKHEMSCLDGACVPVLWRCDGESDCPDSSDEMNCNATRCNDDTHFRCDHGMCIAISWICDGAKHCLDGSDERNCSKPKSCTIDEFQCESNGACIDHILRCNGKADCTDSSDEKQCLNVKTDCKHGFLCKDGACLYDYEICDGHSDCLDNEDEKNCTRLVCQSGEVLCPTNRCIFPKWICDGDEDCSDGSDEENCIDNKTHVTTLPTVPAKDCSANDYRCVNGQCLPQAKRCNGIKDCLDGSDEVNCLCDGFFCSATGRCLPWSVICDGNEDCQHMSDEGGLCSTSCAGGKGNCSHRCQKTPRGSKCFCDEGFRLLSDNKTCEDMNECQELDACSHYCSNRKGSYKCSCAHGYRLHDDKHSCVAKEKSATLIYLLKDVIRGLDLETYSSKFHLIVKGADMKGFDFDVTEKVFYWTDLNEESIDSYSTNNNSHDVVYRSCSRPVAVKYDWLAKNLYFLDQKSNIGVCTKNGKFCKTLIKSGAQRIDSMTISPPSGYMFWTVWARSLRYNISGVIRRAEMNGSHIMSIVSSQVFYPTAITVDPVLEVVYWSDIKLKTLECANFYGFKRRRVLQSVVRRPVASAVFEDYIYWADWGTNNIMKCHKFIKGKCENVTTGNVKAHDLLVAHKVMQPKRNSSTCLVGNGGCSHLCLTARKGSTCACLDGIELDVDGRTCLAPKCEENEFRCEDGLCISVDLRCDGNKACNDGSDEVNCEAVLK